MFEILKILSKSRFARCNMHINLVYRGITQLNVPGTMGGGWPEE